jgi:hypothetical protein
MMQVYKEAKDAILELQNIFAGNDRVVVLQASSTTYCAGAYSDGSFKQGVVILFNNDDDMWEILEGDRANETVTYFFAYMSCLFDLAEEKLESEAFGVDTYKYFQ